MNKILIIQKLLDHAISFHEATELLSCSARTVRRYAASYKTHGPPGLIHGLKGKPSNNRTKKRGKLEQYARKKCYQGFGPTLLAEKLETFLGYAVPVESLRRRMIERGLRTAKKPRAVKRQPRERRQGYGIMIQFDGSYHDRLENGEERCLLLAVDDATGDPVQATFTRSEAIEDVILFRSAYFQTHGKPASIYLDCHASYKVNHRKDQFDQTTITRFQRGMNRLGITVIFSKSPQGKGRVENKFKLFQDRGIKEMRLAGITSYDEAAIFLQEKILPQFKEKFSVRAKEQGDYHVPITHEEMNMLEWYFAKQTQRTINAVGIVTYQGQKYLIKKGTSLNGTREVTVLESHLGNIQLRNGDMQLYFEKVRQ